MDEAARFARMMTRSAELELEAARSLSSAVLGVVDVCERSLRAGGKLMFCGNGGSAADSQHLATELLIRLRATVERGSWPALALTLDPAALTACGNDFGFEHVFERPLRGVGRAGDVLFGLTTSGRSANVVRALAAARDMRIANRRPARGRRRAGHTPLRPGIAGCGPRDRPGAGMPYGARPRDSGIAGGPSRGEPSPGAGSRRLMFVCRNGTVRRLPGRDGVRSGADQ